MPPLKSKISIMDMGTRYSVWTSAQNAYLNGQYERSLRIYSSLRHLPQVLFNMASILIKMGNYSKAIDFLTKAVTKEEKFAIAYYQRAFCLFSMQKYEAAIIDLSTAEKLLSTHSIDYLPAGLKTNLYKCEILYNAAQCYLELDNPQEAEIYRANAAKFVVSDCQASVIKKSQKHFYCVEKGLQFVPELKLQSLGTAEPTFRDALKRQPQNSQILKRPEKSSMFKINTNLKPALTSKSFILDHLSTCNLPIASSSPIVTPSSPGVFSSSPPKIVKRKNSIFKIQSPEGNVMISLEQNSTLQDLKEKVSFKLSQIGFSHDSGLSIIKDGIILKTNDDFKHLLQNEEIVHLIVE